jgi:hypothetical protein
MKLFQRGHKEWDYKKLLPALFHESIMSSEIENKFIAELKHAAGPLVELGLYDSPYTFIKGVTSDFISIRYNFIKNSLKHLRKNMACPSIDFQKNQKQDNPFKKKITGWNGKLHRTC